MSKKNVKNSRNLYVGLDLGNGTVIGYTDDDGVDDQVFIPSMETSGEQFSHFSMGDYGVGGTDSIPEDKQSINGNRPLLTRNVNGVTKVYGLNCMHVAKDSFNAVGKDRYKFTDRLRGLYEMAVTGFNNVSYEAVNNVYLCVGMAPGLYTNELDRVRIIEYFHKAFDDYKFYSDDLGCSFVVQDLVVTGEGLGVYYDHVTNLKAKDKINRDRLKKGYLVVDAGRGTFDSMVIKGFKLMQGARIESNESLGSTKMFQDVAKMYNAQTSYKLSAFDVEIFVYMGSTPKDVDEALLTKCLEAQKEEYLISVASYLQDMYSSQTDYFSEILLTGGITEIFREYVDFEGMITFGDKPITNKGVSSNAKGFYNVARVSLPKRSKK